MTIAKLTREGKPVAEFDSRLRESVHEKALCKTCVHLTDSCRNLDVEKTRVDGFTLITTCKGYEKL